MSCRLKEIKSFHPLNIALDAVYYQDDDKLERIPVLGLAIYDEVIYSGDGMITLDENIISIEKGYMKYVTFAPTDFDFNEDEGENLLGYEIHGQQKDWRDEIESYKKRQLRKVSKPAGGGP
jgi:hypothetical protein